MLFRSRRPGSTNRRDSFYSPVPWTRARPPQEFAVLTAGLDGEDRVGVGQPFAIRQDGDVFSCESPLPVESHGAGHPPARQLGVGRQVFARKAAGVFPKFDC